ncbi:MAG TPA: sigma-70 family RNA polymerase sigma factor [Jatrophihabitantaceae bacterium]
MAALAPGVTGGAHCTVTDAPRRSVTTARASGSGVPTSDAELMRALHDQHARALWSYAVHLTGGDRARAEDVVQETMLRAWKHPQVLDQSEGSARAWLFTVARRIVIDDWRTSRSRHEVVTAEPPELHVADPTEGAADAAVVTAALRQLSVEHRQVVLECYYRGSSVAEAARRLGVPEGTVKSRAHYALRALRLALDELGGV